MLIRDFLLVCVSLAAFASTITALAGEAPDIFAIIQLDPPASPPGGRYLQTYTVGLDMEAMQQPASALTLNLPGRKPETVQLVHWEPRQGYIQIPDPNDPTGLGSITIPDPTAKPEDFWWRWYGTSENYTVALTVVQGVIAGRITSANHRYAVEPRGDGLIRLGVVNSEFWRTHPHDPEDQPKSFQAVHADSPAKQVMPASSLIGTASTRGGWDASCSAPAPGGQQVIDVLLLYSEGLLSRYFGNTASVHAVLQASIDDANQSLRNSNISGVVFSPRGPELLPNPSGFDYDTFEIEQVLYRAAGVVRHLGVPYYTFPGNSYVSGRRDTQWADIVAVARDGTLEGTCGVSFANRVVVNNDYETEPGPDFEKFAYIVIDPGCNADRLNLAHELGHQLGMEHDPTNFDAHFIPGIDPSCPWSFGHKRSTGDQRFRFRTVMSYWQDSYGAPGGPSSCGSSANCPQIDAYSTPLLEWAGDPGSGGLPPFGLQPVGTVSGASPIGVGVATWPTRRADGADTIKRIAPIVQDYRARPNVIFANGFQ